MNDPVVTVSPPLRVLHLTRWLHHGGGGIRSYIANLSAALAESSSIELHAAAVESGEPLSYLPNVHYHGAPAASEMIKAWYFWRWLRTGIKDVDLLHLHGIFGWPFMLGGLACVLYGKPYVVSPHGAFSAWFISRKTLKKRLFLKMLALPLMRRSSGIIATSHPNAVDIQALDSRLPVHLVLPGVPVEPQPSVQFLKDGGGAHQLRILYLGRLDAVKDVPTLIRAVSRLRSENRDVRLDIVGWGTPEATLEVRQITTKLQLESTVFFRGYLDGAEKLAIIRAAHVMAVPSHSENFSFAVAEALAVGLPVVATSGVALSELISRHDCGRVVPPGDADAMAKALTEYVNPQTRSVHAVRAHQAAHKELSLRVQHKVMESLYWRAVNTGRKRT